MDFALSPFRGEVMCAGEDGVVRVWTLEGEKVSEMVGMEKVVMGEWSPVADGLLGVLGVDMGKCEFTVWDVKSMQSRRVQLGYTVTPKHTYTPGFEG